jgi:hypothetical protein
MPSEPRLLALRDDLVDTLNTMSRANGYWYNYQGTQIGAVADWDAAKDFEEMKPHLIWDGELVQDDLHGGEAVEGGAPNRFRHWDRFAVTFAIKDKEDPERVAWRVWADVHEAIMTDRTRGGTRVNTFDVGRDWIGIDEAGQPIGGLLSIGIVIRWDHLTGDTTSQ